MSKEKFNKISYNNSYNSQTYDRINLMLKKGKKELIQDYAEKQGYSVNGYINKAIDEKIERDKKSEEQ